MSRTIQEDLASLGIELKTVHRPRIVVPLIHIIVPAASSAEMDVAVTAASVLASACQDFTVDIVGGEDPRRARVREWLSTDARFRFVESERVRAPGSVYTLVLHPGTRLGTFSLEALVDAHEASGAVLLRALVDGQRGAAEFWRSVVLDELLSAGNPEQAVRKAGGERWLSGNSLGLYDRHHPAPKMHLRKGAAGRHDLTIIVRDSSDPSTRSDYEQRIRHLESKLARSEAARRRLEAGIAPQRALARLGAAAQRGPAYVYVRARTAMGWLGKP